MHAGIYAPPREVSSHGLDFKRIDCVGDCNAGIITFCSILLWKTVRKIDDIPNRLQNTSLLDVGHCKYTYKSSRPTRIDNVFGAGSAKRFPALTEGATQLSESVYTEKQTIARNSNKNVKREYLIIFWERKFYYTVYIKWHRAQ